MRSHRCTFRIYSCSMHDTYLVLYSPLDIFSQHTRKRTHTACAELSPLELKKIKRNDSLYHCNRCIIRIINSNGDIQDEYEDTRRKLTELKVKYALLEGQSQQAEFEKLQSEEKCLSLRKLIAETNAISRTILEQNTELNRKFNMPNNPGTSDATGSTAKRPRTVDDVQLAPAIPTEFNFNKCDELPKIFKEMEQIIDRIDTYIKSNEIRLKRVEDGMHRLISRMNSVKERELPYNKLSNDTRKQNDRLQPKCVAMTYAQALAPAKVPSSAIRNIHIVGSPEECDSTLKKFLKEKTYQSLNIASIKPRGKTTFTLKCLETINRTF